jgi:hypothetical protein
MKIAYSLTAQKPNWLNIIFWLTDYINDEWIIVQQPTYLGSIELNGSSLITNIESSVNGFYPFKIKVHASKFDALATGGIGKIKMIIGSLSTELENPPMHVLKQTDKPIDESSVIEISKQKGLWDLYPWNQENDDFTN